MACVACPSTDEFPFLADRHAHLILAQINKMRCGQHFCDVQLQVGEKLFKVHRLVLAASSPYFAALFAGGMKESSKDVVQILGVDADIFQILVDFIYTGTLISKIFSLLLQCLRSWRVHVYKCFKSLSKSPWDVTKVYLLLSNYNCTSHLREPF